MNGFDTLVNIKLSVDEQADQIINLISEQLINENNVDLIFRKQIVAKELTERGCYSDKKFKQFEEFIEQLLY